MKKNIRDENKEKNMYCSYCGKPVGDKQRFCSYCGEKIKNGINDTENSDEENETHEAINHAYVEENDTSADVLKEIFKEMDEEKEAEESYQTEDIEDDKFHLSFTGYIELIVLLILFVALIFHFKKWVIDPKPEVIQKTEKISVNFDDEYKVSIEE